MNRRTYKIIEEKFPDEDFTRYTPMVANTTSVMVGQILKESEVCWERVPIPRSSKEIFRKSFAVIREDAERAIDMYENIQKKLEGAYITKETEYTPK